LVALGSGREAKHWPPPTLPEYAFIGRSNVGKSSLINMLCGIRKLARVSNTPGRTRNVEHFRVEGTLDSGRPWLLADLPGYGFAKASKADKAQWQTMITTYLEKRHHLEAVVSIIDAEVGPTPDDNLTLDYLQDKGKRILVVATKIDRLPKARRKPRLQALAQELALPLEAILPFSATEKIGEEEVWEALLGVFGKATRV
jgi:GTP-binding protein